MTLTPSAELVKRLAASNTALETRVSDLECKQPPNHDEPRKRKHDRAGSEPQTVSKRTASRQREAAANAEIGRLKLELAILRAEGCPGYLAMERRREEGFPVLPKRALTLAGYWNVLSNDILAITPVLVAAVEAKGGSVLRRDGMHLCFRGRDRALVIETVLELMPRELPQYRRRSD